MSSLAKRRPFAAGFAVIALALVLSACGGGGSSTSSGTTEATSNAADSGSQGSTISTGTKPAGKPYYILAATSLTGERSPGDINSTESIEAAVEVIDEEGGVLGRPVEVKTADIASDPSRCPAALQGLLESTPKQDILWVLPGFYLDEEGACEGTLQRSGELGYLSSGNESLIDPAKLPLNFVTTPSGVLLGKAQAAAALAVGGKGASVGLLFGNSAPDQENLPEVKESVEAAGLDIATTVSADEASTDLTPQLLQLKEKDVKVIVSFFTTPQAYVAMMEGVQSLGWSDVEVIAPPFEGETLSQITAAQEQYHLPLYAPGVQGLGEGPAFESFISHLEAQGNELGNVGNAGVYFDLTTIFAEAVKQAGSTEPQKVAEALESLGNSLQESENLIFAKVPGYSSEEHTLESADYSHWWGLADAGEPNEDGQFPGEPLVVGP